MAHDAGDDLDICPRSEAAKNRENAARAGNTAYDIAAGAAYAVVRKRWPGAVAARGLPFGAGFFMMVDELLNPGLGLTPGPRAFPWQTHARGLGGHLAFGLTTDSCSKAWTAPSDADVLAERDSRRRSRATASGDELEEWSTLLVH